MLPNTNANVPTPVNKTDNESTMSADNMPVSTKTSEQPEFNHPPQEIQTEMASIEGVGPSSSAPMEDGSENISKPSNFTEDDIEEIKYCEDKIGALNDDGTSIIDSILKQRQSRLLEIVDNHNKFVMKFSTEGKLSKKDKRRYSSARDYIKKCCGILKRNVTKLIQYPFNPKEFLIDRSVVTCLQSNNAPNVEGQIYSIGSSISTARSNSRLPNATLLPKLLNLRGKKCGTVRQKRRLKMQKYWNYEQQGLKIIQERPDLLKEKFSDLAKAQKLVEQSGDKKKAKKLRRQMRFQLIKLAKEQTSQNKTI